MKALSSVFTVALFAGVFFCSCGANDANAKSDSAGAHNTVVSGAQLYMDNCVVCHGEDGTAGMTGATDLSKSVLTHDNMIGVITNGRNTMRSFGSQFSKEEIEALAGYVETLRK